MRKLKSLALITLFASISVFTVNVKAATTLPEAVDGKITLTEDVNITEEQTISGNVTLDLNGHKIIKPVGSYYGIKNTGTLTIIDSGSTKGEIECSFKDASAGTVTCIDNTGTLTLDGVKVSSTVVAVKNEPTGTTTIKNSTILGLTKTKNYENGAVLNAHNMRIENSTVSGADRGINITGASDNSTTATKTEIIDSNITGGIFENNPNKTSKNEVVITNGTYSGALSTSSSNNDIKVSGNINVNNVTTAVQDTSLGIAKYAENGTIFTMMNTSKVGSFTIPKGVTLKIPSDITITLSTTAGAVATIDGTLEGKLDGVNAIYGNSQAVKLITLINNYIPKNSDETQKAKLEGNITDSFTKTTFQNTNLDIDLNGYYLKKDIYVWSTTKLNITDSSEEKAGTILGYIYIEDGGSIILPSYMELVNQNSDYVYTLNKINYTFKKYSVTIKAADYSEYDELLETAEKLDSKKYTADSYLDLQKVLDSAATFIGDRSLSGSLQAKIDEHSSKIRDALSALMEIPASIDPESKGISLGVIIDDETSTMLLESRSDALQEKIDEALEAGKIISTEIVTEVIDLENLSDSLKEDIQKIKDNLGTDINTAYFLDLSILVKVNGDVLGNIPETRSAITFKVAVPEELLKENREFYIYRLHNGKVEKLNTKLEGNIITFESNEFSTYALAYEDVTEETVENPKTGDNIMIYGALLGLSIAGTVIVLRKKENN